MSGSGPATRHVIHRLDPCAREAGEGVNALMEREPGRHVVVWIGEGTGALERSRHDPAGLAVVRRVGGLEGGGAVRAWGAAAVRAVAGAGVREDVSGVVLAPPPNALGALARRSLRRAFGEVKPVFGDDAVRRLWSERLGMAEVEGAAVEAFGAGVSGAAGRSARETVRASLGADEGAVVVVDVGGPAAQRDAHRLTFAVGVLTLAGVRCHALVHPRSRGVELSRGFTAHHGGRWGLSVDDRSVEELLSGVDVALWLVDPWVSAGYPTRRSPATTLGLRAAIEAGVAVVAEEHALSRGFGGQGGVELVPAGDALAMTRAIAGAARRRRAAAAAV